MPRNRPVVSQNPPADARHILHFRIHNVVIAIWTDSSQIAQAILARLEPLAAPNTVTADLVFAIWSASSRDSHPVVRPQGHGRPLFDPPNGEVLYFEAGDQLYVSYEDEIHILADLVHAHTQMTIRTSNPNNIWLVSHPLLSIPLGEHLKRHNLFRLHAAGLCSDGRGLIISGRSGAGKSTLTLALLRSGFGFMGDDMLFLAQGDEGLQVFAFPEDIDVTERTMDLFPELQERTGHSKLPGARKWQVSPQQVYDLGFVPSCKPSVILFPQITEADTSRLQPLDKEEALIELLPNVLPTEPSSTQKHLDALGELVRSCRCYRMHTGKDLDALPERLLSLLA